jgi:Ser/Thr protein kinase RdoA (MazF antagonist)
MTGGLPAFETDWVEAQVARVWGLAARAEPLVGWADANFLLVTDDADRRVLKISPPDTRRETLENQASMLLHLAAGELSELVPRVVPAADGRVIARMEAPGGEPRWTRLLTYLEGRRLVELDRRPSRLLAEIGRTLATLDLELTSFDHPATPRSHEWDVMTVPDLARLARHIDDPGRRALVENHLDRFTSVVLPLRKELEHGVIHADANDHNLLVTFDDEDPRLSGIIDFSDLLASPIVADLAISLAYLMLDRDDPVSDAVHLIRGYHEVRALTGLERRLLPDLVTARICSSLLHAAHGLARDPDNAYLQISAAPMWRLLEGVNTTDGERFSRAVETACS